MNSLHLRAIHVPAAMKKRKRSPKQAPPPPSTPPTPQTQSRHSISTAKARAWDPSQPDPGRPLLAPHLPHGPNLPLEKHRPFTIHRRRCLPPHIPQAPPKRRRLLLPPLPLPQRQNGLARFPKRRRFSLRIVEGFLGFRRKVRRAGAPLGRRTGAPARPFRVPDSVSVFFQ
ncbi:hypothetical protein E2542_SST03007 [Spatholobus suberectus]|nr:hypothetical protein E2542_SST03007 [Spatholobus suberectus]